MSLIPIPIYNGKIVILIDNCAYSWIYFPVFRELITQQIEQFKQDHVDDQKLFSFNICASSKLPIKFCDEFCELDEENIESAKYWLTKLHSTSLCDHISFTQWLTNSLLDFSTVQCKDLVLFVFHHERPLDMSIENEFILKKIYKIMQKTQQRLHPRYIMIMDDLNKFTEKISNDNERNLLRDIAHISGGTFSDIALCNNSCKTKNSSSFQCINKLCKFLQIKSINNNLEYSDNLPDNLRRYPWHFHYSEPEYINETSTLIAKLTTPIKYFPEEFIERKNSLLNQYPSFDFQASSMQIGNDQSGMQEFKEIKNFKQNITPWDLPAFWISRSSISRGIKVLARRKDGSFHKGYIAKNIEKLCPKMKIPIEFDQKWMSEDGFCSKNYELVNLCDLVDYCSALRHQIKIGDRVLVEDAKDFGVNKYIGPQFLPATVVMGFEPRSCLKLQKITSKERYSKELIVIFAGVEKVGSFGSKSINTSASSIDVIWIPEQIFQMVCLETCLPKLEMNEIRKCSYNRNFEPSYPNISYPGYPRRYEMLEKLPQESDDKMELKYKDDCKHLLDSTNINDTYWLDLLEKIDCQLIKSEVKNSRIIKPCNEPPIEVGIQVNTGSVSQRNGKLKKKNRLTDRFPKTSFRIDEMKKENKKIEIISLRGENLYNKIFY